MTVRAESVKSIQLLSTVTVRFAGTAVTENGMLKEMVSLITFRDATADATPYLSYAAPPPDVMAKEAVALLRQGQDPQFRRESVRILVGMHIVERGSVHSLTEKA